MSHSLLLDYHDRGNLRARERVIEQYLPLVRSLARRYAHRGEDFEDLVQVGSVGLVKAVDRFEPARRVSFATFATPTILGEIKRHLRDSASPVRLPRRLQELELRLTRLAASLESERGGRPTLRELARSAGIAEEEAAQALGLRHARVPVSLSAAAGADGGLQPSEPSSAEEALRLSEDRAAVATGLRALAPLERRVLHLHFYEGLSQAQIAVRMDISQTRVSRLIRGALEKLREALTGSALGLRDPASSDCGPIARPLQSPHGPGFAVRPESSRATNNGPEREETAGDVQRTPASPHAAPAPCQAGRARRAKRRQPELADHEHARERRESARAPGAAG